MPVTFLLVRTSSGAKFREPICKLENMDGEGWLNIGRRPMAWGSSWESIPQTAPNIKEITCETGEQYFACMNGFRGCATHNPCSLSTTTEPCTTTTVATVSHLTTTTQKRVESTTCTSTHSSVHSTSTTCTSSKLASTPITTSTPSGPHSDALKSVSSICTSSHSGTSTCTSAHASTTCTSTLPYSNSTVCTSVHSDSTTCKLPHSTSTLCTSDHSGSTTCTLPHSSSTICTSSHSGFTTCTSQHTTSSAGKIETRLPLGATSTSSAHSSTHSPKASSTHSSAAYLPSALVCPHANNTIHECDSASYLITCQADSTPRSYHQFSVGAGGYEQCFDYCSGDSKCAGFTFTGDSHGDCLFKSALPDDCYVPKKEPGHITCAKLNHKPSLARRALHSDVTDKGAIISSGVGLFVTVMIILTFLLWLRRRRVAQQNVTVLRARRRTSRANYDEPPSPLPLHEDEDDVYHVPPPYRDAYKSMSSTAQTAGVQPVPAQHHARQRSIYKTKSGSI